MIPSAPTPPPSPSAASIEDAKTLLVAFRYLSSRSGVGMRDLPDHLVKALVPEVAIALDAAVQGERERCAKVCEERRVVIRRTKVEAMNRVGLAQRIRNDCAAAIREGRTP